MESDSSYSTSNPPYALHTLSVHTLIPSHSRFQSHNKQISPSLTAPNRPIVLFVYTYISLISGTISIILAPQNRLMTGSTSLQTPTMRLAHKMPTRQSTPSFQTPLTAST